MTSNSPRPRPMRRGLHVGLLLALLLAATSPTPLAKGGADDGVEY